MNWYFGTDISQIGSNQFDFLTVATHELMHLAGFGTANSWRTLISNGTFTGAKSRAANGGQAVALTAERAHWAEDVSSDGQEALMDPSIDNTGIRKLPTTLDFAGLDDIGWTLDTQQVQVSASKRYADNGTYPVSITLNGSQAGTVSRSLASSIVTNVAPGLEQLADATVVVGTPLTISDLGKFSDPGFGSSETFGFQIDWGDSSALDSGSARITRAGSAGVATLGAFDGSHVYSQVGNFTVRYRITDDDGGTDQKAFLVKVTAPTRLILSIDKSSVDENAGANAAELTISLAGSAAGQAATIGLSNSSPSKLSVPASVNIPAGATSVKVPVAVIDNDLLDGNIVATLSATFGTIAAESPVMVTVVDKETVTLALNRTSVREDAGSANAILRVTRNNTNLDDALQLSLQSSIPNLASLPSTVTIASGSSFIDVAISVADNSSVDGVRNAVFTASTTIAAYSFNSQTLEITDFEPIFFVGPSLVVVESSSPVPTNVEISIPGQHLQVA